VRPNLRSYWISHYLIFSGKPFATKVVVFFYLVGAHARSSAMAAC
jgi:hypothetical protein